MGDDVRSRWGAFARGADEVDRRVRARTWSLEARASELEREVADLGRILAALGEGVVAVDRAGIVRHANPAAIEMLGMQPGGSIGSHMFVAVPHQGVCDALEETMRSGEAAGTIVREVEGPAPREDRTYRLLARPLREHGRDEDVAEGAIAVLGEVTDIRRLERARQDFFANVSHELKTPITAIRGALETILDDPDMPDEVRTRFLGSAQKHATRLGTLVTDLMSLARLESGSAALQLRPVDIAALAAEVAASAEHMAAVREVELWVDVRSEPRTLAVCGDEEALRQAISNLVDNAVAYSEPGGTVAVTVERRGGLAVVEVVDTGAGIATAELDRIFERFYRSDAARSRERGGTGIGLSIVKHVAQSHMGAAEVESCEGAGSTFRLAIPVSSVAAAGTSTP